MSQVSSIRCNLFIFALIYPYIGQLVVIIVSECMRKLPQTDNNINTIFGCLYNYSETGISRKALRIIVESFFLHLYCKIHNILTKINTLGRRCEKLGSVALTEARVFCWPNVTHVHNTDIHA